MPSEEKPLYDLNRLRKYFMLASLFFLACVVWAFADDYNKPYKKTMRRAHRIEVARLRAALKDARENVKDRLSKTSENYEKEEARLEGDPGYQSALQARRSLATDVEIKTREYNDAKARFEVIVSRKQGIGARVNPDTDTEIVGARKEMERRRIAKEESEKALQDHDKKIRGFKKDLRAYKKLRNELEEEQVRVEKRIEAIEPSLVNLLRETPGIDFINPLNKIRQTKVDGLDYDIHFATAKRIDRCQTCHAMINKAGYEPGTLGPDGRPLAQPFLTHPRLELFVGSESPHKMSEFGCTTCHEGQGRALEFSRAAHTPDDLTGRDNGDRERWEEERGWHETKHWEYPMLPKLHTEASCYKCHKEIVDIPQAESLTKGWRIFREVGCFGCHKIEGFEDLPKVGPNLTHIAQKTTPDWVHKWIKNPRGFRPTTKMPHFFGQTNQSTDALTARSDAEIAAIVAYLFAKSNERADTLVYPPNQMPPLDKADRANGERIFKTRGCLACHRIGANKLERHDRHGNEFGPDLANLGSKVSVQWLRQWIREPSLYFKGSRMPDLRLTDSEVADVAAYLVGQKDKGFEASSTRTDFGEETNRNLLKKALEKQERIRQSEGGLKQVAEQTVNANAHARLDKAVQDGTVLEELEKINVDQMALYYKRQKATYADAHAKLDAMSYEQKKLFVGERLIARYGCSGCHAVPGFEKAQRIGTELTKEGAKDLHKFDFGQQLKKQAPSVKNNRLSWIYNKLKNPRLYDEGLIKDPEALLKMPNFNFTDDEARAMVTFVTGLTGENVSKEYLAPRPPNNSPEQIARYDHKMTVDKGRKLLMKYNCIACHTVGVFEKRLANPVELGTNEDDEEEWATPLYDEGFQHNYWLARDLQVKIPGDPEAGRDDAVTLQFKKGTFFVDILNSLKKHGLEWKDFAQVQKNLDVYGWREGGIALVVEGQYRQRTGKELDQSKLLERIPPLLKGEGGKVYSQWLQKFLKAPQRLRPLNKEKLALVMPTFPMSPQERRDLAQYFAVVARQLYPSEPPEATGRLTDTELTIARAAVSTCIKCHASGDPTTYTEQTVAPSLTYAKSRLKRTWLEAWLVKPSRIMPGTGMPDELFDRDRGMQTGPTDVRDGARVLRVFPESSLAIAGIRKDDVVTKVGDTRVKTPDDFRSAWGVLADNATVTIVVRRGEQNERLSVPATKRTWVIGKAMMPPKAMRQYGLNRYTNDHRDLMIRYLMQFNDTEGAVLRKMASEE